MDRLKLISTCFLVTLMASCAHVKYEAPIIVGGDIRQIEASDGSFILKPGKSLAPRNAQTNLKSNIFGRKCYEFFREEVKKIHPVTKVGYSGAYDEAVRCGAKPVVLTSKGGLKMEGLLLINPTTNEYAGVDSKLSGNIPLISLPESLFEKVESNPNKLYAQFEHYVLETPLVTDKRYAWVIWLSGLPF